jgi:hypothetical protein
MPIQSQALDIDLREDRFDLIPASELANSVSYADRLFRAQKVRAELTVFVRVGHLPAFDLISDAQRTISIKNKNRGLPL